MPAKRIFIHSVFLFLLPLVAVGFSWSLFGCVLALLLMLLWRWLISLSTILAPAKSPDLVLDSISASHFVEKVRWCLDRLGVEYHERPSAGALGAFFAGRTVPLLHFKTGAVFSRIGNSPEILRYLWGRYVPTIPAQAEFLRADANALELEERIDRVGANLQVWVYFHILSDADLTLHAWGQKETKIALWQRLLLPALRPVLSLMIRKSFRITAKNHAKSVEHISALLSDMETRLADGRRSLLGGATPNYVDFSFAAINGLWLQPENYGAGAARSVNFSEVTLPAAMGAEIQQWRENYPLCTAFIEQLYQEERLHAT